MSSSPAAFDGKRQLEELASALCDGEITPPQAARLEELVMQSRQARRHLVNYLLLHAELSWDLAGGGTPHTAAKTSVATAAAETPDVASPAGRARRSWWRSLAPRTRRWAGAAAAVLILAASLSLAMLLNHALKPPAAVARQDVARLTGAHDAVWSAAAPAPALVSGQRLALDEGLAEVTFDSGVSVMLHAPCLFRVETRNRGRLEAGSLRASVPPEASGFEVRTPAATVVDRGTEIGVSVERDGTSAVHVFAGRVDLLVGGESGSPQAPQEVTAGQAFRVQPGSDGEGLVQAIRLDRDQFAWQIPPSVGRLRGIVAADRRVIHHYTFEGFEREEICQDKRGGLDLEAVAMAGGTGGRDIYEQVLGFRASGNSVRSWRSQSDGNRVGIGLQSNGVFSPPDAFTVELLLKLEDDLVGEEDAIAAAVATRASRRNCGLLVAVVAPNRLSYRLDEDAPWGPGDVVTLAPGNWYYVAFTFRPESGRTLVNGYVADLTAGERKLTPFVAAQSVPGVPRSGPLGIGKGFDENLESAYPWPGILDEVAIYGEALSRQTLQEHLEMILPEPQDDASPLGP